MSLRSALGYLELLTEDASNCKDNSAEIAERIANEHLRRVSIKLEQPECDSNVRQQQQNTEHMPIEYSFVVGVQCHLNAVVHHNRTGDDYALAYSSA